MSKILLSLCLILIFSMPAQAADWVEGDHFRARLAAVPEGSNRIAVLEIEMEEGWHTYGQEPGDAGLPPRFHWDKSKNLKDVNINWPPTKEKREFDMFTVNAYEGLTQFLLDISPEINDQNVDLDLNLQIMVCSDICIPAEADLSLSLIYASHIP